MVARRQAGSAAADGAWFYSPAVCLGVGTVSSCERNVRGVSPGATRARSYVPKSGLFNPFWDKMRWRAICLRAAAVISPFSIRNRLTVLPDTGLPLASAMHEMDDIRAVAGSTSSRDASTPSVRGSQLLARAMSSERPTPQNLVLYDRLHRVAQARLHAGELPRGDPTRTYGGRGSALNCALCDAAILQPEIEMELVYSAAGNDSGERTIHLHLYCHSIWNYERHRIAR